MIFRIYFRDHAIFGLSSLRSRPPFATTHYGLWTNVKIGVSSQLYSNLEKSLCACAVFENNENNIVAVAGEQAVEYRKERKNPEFGQLKPFYCTVYIRLLMVNITRKIKCSKKHADIVFGTNFCKVCKQDYLCYVWCIEILLSTQMFFLISSCEMY